MKTLLLSLWAMACFTLAAKSQSPEAIHVHFDKDIYLPGETIWFKAYLYNGYHSSGLSTNFYAAIYDEDGKLLQQKQYPIFEGTASGDFSLPDTLNSRRIQFLSFTPAMRATDSSNLYKRTIDIYHEGNTTTNFRPNPDNSVALEFFPEGGKVIEGITNYIAYKVSDKNGSPAQAKGSIVELGNNNEIDSFYTNEFGMGKIQLIPQPEKTYFAIWKNAAGQIVNTPLPVVHKEGAGLHIDQAGNILYCVITKNTNTENLKTLRLTARIGNDEIYQSTMVFNNTMKIVNQIPLDSLGNGLIQFTLSDANNNALQNRVVLANKKDKAPILSQVERSVGPKGKNTIEFSISDTSLYNLSASISDINFYNKSQHNGIQQELWFTKVSKAVLSSMPSDILEISAANVDLVTLANGWHKYTFSQPTKTDDYLSITLKYQEKNYALPKNETATLVVKDKTGGNQFYVIPQTSQTSFTQTGLIFYDSTKLSYKTDKTKYLEKFLTLEKSEPVNFLKQVDKLESIVSPDAAQPIVSREENDSEAIESFYVGKSKKFNEERTIKTVTIKSKYVNPETKRLLELDEKYATGMFRGIGRGYQINVVDDEDAWTAFDLASYIAYRFPFLRSANGLYNTNNSGNAPVKVLTFLDEVEMPDQQGLAFLSISQIAYVKFVSGIVIGSSFTTPDGALFIYTRKGDERVLSHTPNMRSTIIKGYDSPKEFFNPDYSDKIQLSIPDLRSTIYWNPYLVADKVNNKIKIEYYNNDISKKLLLVIEGFNEEGKLIHIEKLIEN